jgi:hypothetical protein
VSPHAIAIRRHEALGISASVSAALRPSVDFVEASISSKARFRRAAFAIRLP